VGGQGIIIASEKILLIVIADIGSLLAQFPGLIIRRVSRRNIIAAESTP